MSQKIISSRDNEFFKRLKRLAGNATPVTAERIALLDGVHLVEACLNAKVAVRHLLLTNEAQSNHEVQHLMRSIEPGKLTFLTMALFRELTSVTTPVGIAAVIAVPEGPRTDVIFKADVLVLDGIQDTGNVGTMLRTAACAGIKQVVLGKGCAGAWTPRVLRAAQGAHFSIGIVEQADLPVWLDLQVVASVGADVSAPSSIYDADLREPKLWVFGSEGQGLSPEVKNRLSLRLSIPMASSMDSLNVSSAAAVCLYEAVRQRSAY